MKLKFSQILNGFIVLCVVTAFILGAVWIGRWIQENRILKQVIERLSAESRAAEILVTKSEFDEVTKKIKTTIKFLEYDAQAKPLPPKYFTFQGNLIQFQSLVVRFDDSFVKAGDRLRGKSAYLFLKAFVLEGVKTQEFIITPVHEIPGGYKIPGPAGEYEMKFWENFWRLALDPKTREKAGVKNAQIEAPGSIFVPGTIYTLKIEHDGGLRIDAQPVPAILKGETVPDLEKTVSAPVSGGPKA